MINKKIKEFYNKNGYYVFKKFHSKNLVEKIKKDIFFVSSQLFLEKTGEKIIPYNSNKFDYYVLKSRIKNYTDITSSVYNTCKKIYGFYEIIASSKIIKISQELMNSSRVGILNTGFGMRIDYPKDTYWKARLHQDYTSQFGSPNGIVAYSALHKVTKNNGAVILYSGTHKRIYKTITNLKLVKSKKTYDPYFVNISSHELNKYDKKFLTLDECDLALFDFRILHESGKNSSKSIRWSVIHRLFDMTNTETIKNYFRGGMNEGNLFSKTINKI